MYSNDNFSENSPIPIIIHYIILLIIITEIEFRNSVGSIEFKYFDK